MLENESESGNRKERMGNALNPQYFDMTQGDKDMHHPPMTPESDDVESLFSIPASPIQSSISLTQPTNVAHTSAATADYSEEVEGQRAIHKLNVQELAMRRQQKINTKFAESLQNQTESYRKEATAALNQQRESDKK